MSLPWEEVEVRFLRNQEDADDCLGRAIDNDLFHPLPEGWSYEDEDYEWIVFKVVGVAPLVKDGEQVRRLLVDLGIVKKENRT